MLDSKRCIAAARWLAAVVAFVACTGVVARGSVPCAGAPPRIPPLPAPVPPRIAPPHTPPRAVPHVTHGAATRSDRPRAGSATGTVAAAAAVDPDGATGGWRPKNLGQCIAIIVLWAAASSLAPYGAILGVALVPVVLEACA